MTDQKLRYFSSVEGRVAPRFGKVGLIGCQRLASGHVWDPEEVVAIPASEITAYQREYGRLLDKEQRGGPSLVECSKADFVKHQEAVKARGAEEAKALADKRKKAKAEGEKAIKAKKKSDAEAAQAKAEREGTQDAGSSGGKRGG